MVTIKDGIKQILTYALHPIVSFHLLREGSRRFYIGPRMNIKGLKYFHIGNGTTIGKDSRFLNVAEYEGMQYTPEIRIGNHVYIAYHFSVMAADSVIIDDNCLIASGVVITSENHGIDPECSESYANTPLEAKPVYIGKGCWIGENAIITPGVRLGERCVVGAGAVVTKSFPGYTIIGGVPAKILKTYNKEEHKWERCDE